MFSRNLLVRRSLKKKKRSYSGTRDAQMWQQLLTQMGGRNTQMGDFYAVLFTEKQPSFSQKKLLK